MPAAPKEAWETARTQWELMPELTITEVAAQLGVAIPTVSIRARREGWSKVVVAEAELPTQTSIALAASALRRLNRIVENSTDDIIATRAATIILGYTLGKPQAAGEQPAGEEPPQDWPEWLTQRRLAYQEAGMPSDDGFEPPAEPVQRAQDAPEALDPPQPTCPPPARLPESPGLRLVETPTFYDGPNQPASGPYRGS